MLRHLRLQSGGRRYRSARRRLSRILVCRRSIKRCPALCSPQKANDGSTCIGILPEEKPTAKLGCARAAEEPAAFVGALFLDLSRGRGRAIKTAKSKNNPRSVAPCVPGIPCDGRCRAEDRARCTANPSPRPRQKTPRVRPSASAPISQRQSPRPRQSQARGGTQAEVCATTTVGRRLAR